MGERYSALASAAASVAASASAPIPGKHFRSVSSAIAASVDCALFATLGLEVDRAYVERCVSDLDLADEWHAAQKAAV